MKNTFKLTGIAGLIALAIILAFTACKRPLAQQFCPEAHFNAWPVDGGAGMRITLYTGGNRAFRDNQLTSVTISNGLTDIESVFAWKQLTSVTIPNSVTNIRFAFHDNRLTSVNIPDSITYIGCSAFPRNQLTSVTIPNSVTSIGAIAFAENPITSITIGANVELIIVAEWLDTTMLRPYPFPHNFHVFYNNNGRRAGTYTWNGTTWSFR